MTTENMKRPKPFGWVYLEKAKGCRTCAFEVKGLGVLVKMANEPDGNYSSLQFIPGAKLVRFGELQDHWTIVKR